MKLVTLKNIQIGIKDNFILDDITFDIESGDRIFLSGGSGSGKTTLLKAIKNERMLYSGERIYHSVNPEIEICYVSQANEIKSSENIVDSFYQQRFNSAFSTDSMTVREFLEYDEMLDTHKILESIKINHLIDTHILKLSNGEQKRLQLAKAVLSNPKILLLDSPFTGIDQKSKKIIADLIKNISMAIVVTGETTLNLDFFTKSFELPSKIKATDNLLDEINYICNGDYDYAFKIKDVVVKYRNKIVLDNISWEVKKGDRWLLRGPNGAGKTTLLSLINGDHPQVYSNDITLFDRKRGTGETIWDIKRKISFFSAELHAYYNSNLSVFETILSGFTDTHIEPKPITVEQKDSIDDWINYLGINNYRNTNLKSLPRGIQRLVLILKALIKNAPLIILDEPCQGLDSKQIEILIKLLNRICLNPNVTLIYVTHELNDIPMVIDKYFDL